MSGERGGEKTDGGLAERLTRTWERAWPGQLPIAPGLKAPDRWVRFHSLPGSKRYADTEAEYEEILRRHHSTLGALHPASAGPLVVVTSTWSEDARPAPTRRRPRARVWPCHALAQ